MGNIARICHRLLDWPTADLLHIVPVVEDTPADGISHVKDTSLTQGLVSHVAVFQVQALVPGSAQRCGKDCPWGV